MMHGNCHFCSEGAILYSATLKDGKGVGVCWRCREKIRRAVRLKNAQ